MAAAVLASADPTPAEIAFGTSHMVTAVNLFSSESAIRAFYYIVVSHIFTKFSIANIITIHPCMLHCPTLKTHFLPAYTLRITFIPAARFLSPNIIKAAHTRAPFEIFIYFNIYVLNKS
jgi:hypothetical protein